MRRTERLFALAEYLRSRKTGVTAEELSARFGVTLRTIYRDLASLRSAELPIRGERGRGGGVALDRSYALPPVNFSPREAAVLISAGQWLTEMRILPFSATLERAVEKVRAALSASGQRALVETLSGLQFVGVPAPAVDEEIRAVVEQAWFERCPLTITYRNSAGVPSERRVRLEGIVMDRSETLLNCYDLDKEAPRQFKLGRIERAEVLKPPPPPPSGPTRSSGRRGGS